jgi:hypothetical protein
MSDLTSSEIIKANADFIRQHLEIYLDSGGAQGQKDLRITRLPLPSVHLGRAAD